MKIHLKELYKRPRFVTWANGGVHNGMTMQQKSMMPFPPQVTKHAPTVYAGAAKKRFFVASQIFSHFMR